MSDISTVSSYLTGYKGKKTYLIRIRNKRNTPRRQNTHPLNMSPFLEMSRNDLLDIITDVNTTNVQCPVLSHKRSDTAHVIPVIAEFIAPETVDVRVEDVVNCGKAMEVFALLTFGTIPGKLSISIQDRVLGKMIVRTIYP